MIRRQIVWLGIVCLFLVGCSAMPTTPVIGEPTPTPSPWTLVWSDEFESETLNPQNWLFDKGAGGWGNNELQYYSNRPENIRIEDGVLIIEARNEEYMAWEYTSARIKTHYLQSWTYGRIEARMKLPVGGKGIWPAFWMLGENIATARWPNCGEIDIMENIGNPTVVYGSVHGPGYSGGNAITKSFVSAVDLSADFHIYAVEWEADEIRWYVDDQLYHTLRREQVPGEWVFDHPFFLILNLAVGGNWPGYPDETTVFPQQLLVDYVRVYQAGAAS
ncbi:MAG TPA: glycoside hydrolase family 16 protein [Chloroflexus aurantiacus]|uniref:Glycoside hydrolase family 16 n=2 Tax=Chloroflexus TaxID=1107 RepID=A9WIK6_CHLAA|nr:glycoside hydrolase family 16 [Chloroflexus aurantiacus J-10-fl]RMG53080.1 MAG: glycoside hydrolase family 16 protein [Chloroflexota bacterium]HBW68543.1 glycoside hydrolase family 16 protein [Chloroflexus aurantiacus]